MSRKKSVSPVSVLGAVDTGNNSVSSTPAAACSGSGSEQSCAQSVNECALADVRKQLADLFASCPPLIGNRVHEYLAMTEGPDAALIGAWSAYGRRDRSRTVDLRLAEVARRTVSPLGYACLIAYARAWLDEAEALAEQARQAARRCCPASDSATTRQPQGTSRPPRVRVGVASRRRRS